MSTWLKKVTRVLFVFGPSPEESADEFMGMVKCFTEPRDEEIERLRAAGQAMYEAIHHADSNFMACSVEDGDAINQAMEAWEDVTK
jgi:hypothetical protein